MSWSFTYLLTYLLTYLFTYLLIYLAVNPIRYEQRDTNMSWFV